MLPNRLLTAQSALIVFILGVFLITVGYLCLTSSFLVPSQIQFVQSNYHSSVLSDQNTVEGQGVDINNATQVELETLPLVGPSTAKKIMASRPYRVKNELVTRKIITEKVFSAIESKIKI